MTRGGHSNIRYTYGVTNRDRLKFGCEHVTLPEKPL